MAHENQRRGPRTGKTWAMAVALAGVAVAGCQEKTDSAGAEHRTADPAPAAAKPAAPATTAAKPADTADKPADTAAKPADTADKPADTAAKPAAADPLAAPPDVAAPPADAVKTASGLASKVLRTGTGQRHPTATDAVKVHYTGWTTDGKMFDSSVARGQPLVFPLNRVIKGWTEGVQLMVEGEKRRLWIPAALAYGENPQGGAPAGMLVFDVELLEIVTPPASK